MKNEKGFTLIEMMIVLLIISILLIITVPNVTSHQKTIQKKGCEAYIHLVEAQVQAYKLDTGEYPDDLTVLSGNKYLPAENPDCDDMIIGIDPTTGQVLLTIDDDVSEE
ncbi:hypothetical protein GCM10008967_40300 [Bacillus carboniphilus]|uniref:ComG operon protein 3 n=1 Tax=Bacillus carboniphilus TaxID=86663 RepID=A0ABP3GHM2_9BACI